VSADTDALLATVRGALQHVASSAFVYAKPDEKANAALDSLAAEIVELKRQVEELKKDG